MTPVEVARLLRHSDPAVTLSVYAGLDDANVKTLGEKLAAVLRELTSRPVRRGVALASTTSREALSGLGGVIIGALISGGATWWMARRAERRSARTAARLLLEQG